MVLIGQKITQRKQSIHFNKWFLWTIEKYYKLQFICNTLLFSERDWRVFFESKMGRKVFKSAFLSQSRFRDKMRFGHVVSWLPILSLMRCSMYNVHTCWEVTATYFMERDWRVFFESKMGRKVFKSAFLSQSRFRDKMRFGHIVSWLPILSLMRCSMYNNVHTCWEVTTYFITLRTYLCRYLGCNYVL
jgi:hypothetical protein